MIVSGGENLFPQEVEDLIANHERSPRWPRSAWTTRSSASACAAFVVTQGAARRATEDELKKHVKDNLANFKVPREIWFIDELPRNATGKVLKRELKEIEKEPK